MVKCSCGKTLDKVPAWLESVQVHFICNNCPNRQIKTISQLSVEQAAAAAALAASQPKEEIPGLDDDEMED